VADVAINFNGRSYRFACGDNEVQRLEEIAKYLTGKLEGLMREHGNIGDERLMLMAALTVADELFDARADVDELLEGAPRSEQPADSAEPAATRRTAFG
jgi:cell division protein ZapA